MNKAIVDVSYLLFSNRRYVGSGAKDALRAYFTSLVAQGLLPMLAAIYTIDEPDGEDENGVPNLLNPLEVVQANADIRAVLSEFGLSIPLAVIYAHSQHPGADSYDIIGQDWYGHPPPRSALQQGQKRLLITGGSNPWRDPPAEPDADTWAVIGFVYFDRGSDLGIGHNGMAPVYRQAGCAITGKC